MGMSMCGKALDKYVTKMENLSNTESELFLHSTICVGSVILLRLLCKGELTMQRSSECSRYRHYPLRVWYSIHIIRSFNYLIDAFDIHLASRTAVNISLNCLMRAFLHVAASPL